MLIRGPTGRCVFGTACSHVRWQLPPPPRRCRATGATGWVDDEPRSALGRSRGGFSTKLHLACEQPQAAGDALDRRAVRDSPQFIAVLDERRVPPSVPAGHSRVRTGSWPTRRTPRQPTAPTCVAGASGRRSRSRPTRPPPGVVGLQRRPSAGLRRDPLQAAPRRRVPHQPAQTQPGSSQPIRETRRPLPRRHPHRRHQRMATQALMKHGLGG
jgi:hypothetical protein